MDTTLHCTHQDLKAYIIIKALAGFRRNLPAAQPSRIFSSTGRVQGVGGRVLDI